MGDEDDRFRIGRFGRGLRALHDGFQRDAVLRHVPGDAGEDARAVLHRKADEIAAVMLADLRTLENGGSRTELLLNSMQYRAAETCGQIDHFIKRALNKLKRIFRIK